MASSKNEHAHLEDIQLDKERGHSLPALGVVLADAEHRLRHKFQHQVQVHLPHQRFARLVVNKEQKPLIYSRFRYLS